MTLLASKEREGALELLPKVRRSDGQILPFDEKFIVESLLRETSLAAEIYGCAPITRKEAKEVARDVKEEIKRLKLEFLSGPLIRELVCVKLLEKSSEDKKYAWYRNCITRVGVPLHELYLMDKSAGYEARENANLQPNPESIHKKKADMLSKEAYFLLIPPRLADAHLKGDIHIHDLEYFGTRPFCQDHDLRYFFRYGLLSDGRGVQTSVAGPAKHAEVAILHAVKVLASAQTNFAGGQGLYGFTYLVAPYLSGLNYKRIRQLSQMLLFELSESYVARGGQLVFSSIQIESGVPKIWRDVPIVKAGKVGSETYGDFEEETNLFAKALLEEYLKGDYRGKMFPFPKPEIALRPYYFKKPEHKEVLDLAAELSAKYGTSYYDNMIPEYRGGEDGVSCYQCCAYNFSEGPNSEGFEDRLYFNDGDHFSMGGMQVVTINMPRLAFEANGNDDLLFEKLRERMEIAKEIHLLKRSLIFTQAEKGLIPFATQRPNGAPPAVNLEGLASTIGTIGMNELVQHHMGEELHESADALRFAIKIVIEMGKIAQEFEKETGVSFAVSRTPAESAAQRLAVADLIHYPEIAHKYVKGDLNGWREKIRVSRDLPVYYTNGCMVNHSAPVPLFKRMDIEQKFFPALSGGNIFHAWLGEAYPNPDALAKLNEKIANQTWIGYFSHTKDISVCNNCSQVYSGWIETCFNCQSRDITSYSRITGYYQAIHAWNEGKKQELRDRYRTKVSDLLPDL